MPDKDILLRLCAETLRKPHIQAWYKKYLEGKPQENTVTELLKGIQKTQISTLEALRIAFTVGFQWHEKFNGVS